MTINKKINRQKEKQKKHNTLFYKKKKRWPEDAQQGETGSILYETKD